MVISIPSLLEMTDLKIYNLHKIDSIGGLKIAVLHLLIKDDNKLIKNFLQSVACH